jgi:hypothetical protein
MQQSEPRRQRDNVEGGGVVFKVYGGVLNAESPQNQTMSAYLMIKLPYFHVSKPQCPRLDVGKASYAKGRREESSIIYVECYGYRVF